MGKILNYTTKIDPDKTAAEIAKILSMNGASAVLTEYDEKEGVVRAISFKISLNGQSIGFRLPCSWEPIYEILVKGKKLPWDENRKAKLEVIEEMERYCTRHISVSEYPQYDACERYGMNTHAEMVARFLSSLKSKYTV